MSQDWKRIGRIGQHDRTVVTGHEAKTGNRIGRTVLNYWREGFTGQKSETGKHDLTRDC